MSDRVTPARSARAVIENYVKGSRDGDAALLRSIVHPDATMIGHFQGTLMRGSAEPFFQMVEHDGTQAASYDAEIIEVLVDGHSASATLVERGFAGLDFVDRFHLIEKSGSWQIVSSFFTTTDVTGAITHTTTRSEKEWSFMPPPRQVSYEDR